MNPVTIVGAGPVGLTAALGLAQEGVPCTILDAKKHWTPCGSKAIVLDRGSLEHFDELGCSSAMLEQGLVAKRRRTFFGEQELFATEFPEPSTCGGIPHFLNLPQSRTESILLAHAEKSPLIKILWNHRVTSIKQTTARVTLDVVTDNCPITLDTRYVIAADGCGSPIRKMCGLGFPGCTNPSRFLIADVKVDLPFNAEHRFFFSHPRNPGRTTLFVPQPDGIWRIDWQLPPCCDGKQEQGHDDLSARIRTTLGGEHGFEILWVSCYQFHQRIMKSLSHGRIFFAGDAAHLVNPFGARGMNSGVQDARSIAWKMSQVLLGKASTCFLETYDTERGAANRLNQVVTRKTMNFIAPQTWLGTKVRNSILHLSRHSKRFRSLVNSGKMSKPPNKRERTIPTAFAIK